MPHLERLVPPEVAAKLDELASQHAEIGQRLGDPAVLADHEKVRELSVKRAALDPVVAGWTRARALLSEIDELRGVIDADSDSELIELAKEEVPQLESDVAALVDEVKTALVQSDERRFDSIMMELRAGTGGDEAGLWCRDLMSVYEKYAGKRGWSFEPLDVDVDAEVGGVRHATVNVRGEGVYAELGFESGVHSVKRVPATETQGRVHTSTATVAVLPEPAEVEVTIDWSKDVEEHITTAQGPGGQNVNKVATAVLLRHVPTGVEVRMQETKSQQQNREKAKRLLLARVYEIERERVESERSSERRSQIGTAARSEKVRVYRYQDGIVADQRLTEKHALREVLEGELGGLIAALIEQETARRLAAL